LLNKSKLTSTKSPLALPEGFLELLAGLETGNNLQIAVCHQPATSVYGNFSIPEASGRLDDFFRRIPSNSQKWRSTA
jgi:hypothetical protein